MVEDRRFRHLRRLHVMETEGSGSYSRTGGSPRERTATPYISRSERPRRGSPRIGIRLPEGLRCPEQQTLDVRRRPLPTSYLDLNGTRAMLKKAGKALVTVQGRSIRGRPSDTACSCGHRYSGRGGGKLEGRGAHSNPRTDSDPSYVILASGTKE